MLESKKVVTGSRLLLIDITFSSLERTTDLVVLIIQTMTQIYTKVSNQCYHVMSSSDYQAASGAQTKTDCGELVITNTPGAFTEPGTIQGCFTDGTGSSHLTIVQAAPTNTGCGEVEGPKNTQCSNGSVKSNHRVCHLINQTHWQEVKGQHGNTKVETAPSK